MKKTIGMIYKVDLTHIKDDIEIRTIGDVHAGAKAFQQKDFERDVQWALEKDNRFIITIGDLCDTITRNSVGNPEERQMKIMDQMNYMVKTLEPLAKKGKILGMLGGNHEERTKKDAFIDITQIMSQQLGVKFFEDEILLRLKIHNANNISKPHRYDIYAVHGASGGSTLGGQLNASRKGSFIYPHVDVCFMGHVHGYIVAKDSFYEITTNGAIVQRERVFVVCGTYLGMEPYAKRRSFGPSVIGSPVTTFHSMKHNVSSNM